MRCVKSWLFSTATCFGILLEVPPPPPPAAFAEERQGAEAALVSRGRQPSHSRLLKLLARWLCWRNAGNGPVPPKMQVQM